MIAQLRIRRDTNANWTANNTVLALGELGATSDDPFVIKMGDGTAAWNDLEGFGVPDGGATNEVLAKASADPRDLGWIAVAFPAETEVFESVSVGSAWAVPAGCKAVRVQAQGGGGGGGSGARGGTTTLRHGGTGGQAGGYSDLLLDATDLPSTLYVTVGNGGTGGAAGGSDNSPGNDGNPGQASFVATSSSASFATAVETAIILAGGGAGGAGGMVTTAPTAPIPVTGGQVVGGVGAVPINNATPNQPDNGGGGAGGVLTTGNATNGLGSQGSAIQRGIYGRVGTTSPSPGATGLGGNTSTARLANTLAPGAGGAGGASNPSGTAGTGGAGDRGGGGGGGGASANTFNSGAGGAGGSGFVIITALF